MLDPYVAQSDNRAALGSIHLHGQQIIAADPDITTTS